ncbi:MAG: methyltransferase domain-containing protein [bacterium]|nr:methyltransferase domain-containing protein [bacterium]
MTVEWWETFFDDVWLEGGFGSAGGEAPVEEIDYLWRQLNLRPGSRLADVCCGIGRHSIPLARRGVEVAGVDFCADYLERAEIGAAGLPAVFVRADMRETGLGTGAFDALINMWTSFGYFADEGEDERALAEWSRLLRSGGRLVMSLVNRDGLMRNFQRGRGDADREWLLLEDSEPDYLTGRLTSRWLWVSPAGERHAREINHRIYAVHELVRMGARHDLEIVAAHGSLLGEPAGREHVHMYLTFAKS